MIHSFSRLCLVNNRLGVPADYGTPDRDSGGQLSHRPFEVMHDLEQALGYNRTTRTGRRPSSCSTTSRTS